MLRPLLFEYSYDRGMAEELRERVVVVLVRARNPSNIGAVARAMHDLGYADLRVVNEFPVPFAAAKSAVDAAAVLQAADEFKGVAEAVADCTLVIGTTAVGERVLEHPLHTLAEAAPLVQAHLASDAKAKVGLLFGSEKTGLSNDELSYCHALLTIPMKAREGERHLSMNLGQAVAVCLYALAEDAVSRMQAVGLRPIPHPFDETERMGHPAAAEDMERLTGLLLEALETSGYRRRHPANSREAVIRRLVRRMGLSANDAQVWTGILRQILYSLEGGAEIGADEGRTIESKL
jgi:TrmH family RNA methyltransferase